MAEVLVIATEELGDRTYIAHDGKVAVVIDPQRDIDRVESALQAHGLTCGLVLETHLHNDYVSGGLELSRRTGAKYAVSGADEVEFAREAVRDGDELHAGRMRIGVVATPGHTDGHVSYVVDDGATPVLFSGGSLLYGSVGRTDLVDVDRVDELTRAQYHSARHLAELLPDDTEIFPTHGFGSFCSSGDATGGDTSTIGLERGRNDALTLDDEDDFVDKLVAGLSAYPAYYAHMGAINRSGAGPIDLSAPAMADGDELCKRIAAGEWVVDLRNRTAFAKSHVHGTVSIALEKPFATYLGWVIPWGTPLTLIAESADEITGAQRQLVRIGIDRPVAAAVGEPDDLVAADDTDTYAIATFEELHRADQPLVVDVRRDDERQAGHLEDSIHIPLHSLEIRMAELPHEPLWVHCASGFRASIAASLLARAGFEVVLIDDDWPNAKKAGLNVETESSR